ncbi:hypothetical protein [Paenalcaligenes faecalis]|uniref:hypothetical protein n=1 Tax=Paenalcaligenes faecalis TaxID=2980099 RepID=UPI0022B9C082|nr:hypothetical protein [Paenalcaligenes faecalis]
MNITHLEHIVIALLIQGLFILVFHLIKRSHGEWFGAFFVTALFLGREHAQREYKIGDPSKLVGYEALDIWRWSLDAQTASLEGVAKGLFSVNSFFMKSIRITHEHCQ